jgi:nitroimidazol reductase NimA-like FMN-containing flavoprotein (pyridoxamine 5'-phosphate oxidase superfamily)
MMPEEVETSWRGKVGGMTEEEMERFLEYGVTMHLACLTPDGNPYMVVCWHEWRDGYFWVVPRQRSEWGRHLKNDARVSFVVDHDKTLEKVWGEGLAELIEEPNIGGKWVEVAERMSLRYLGENGPTYLVPTLKQPRWLFRIKPTAIKTWQGVGWARRYWVTDTGGPTYEEAHAS